MRDKIVPVLAHWQYDDEIEDDTQDWMPDMTMTFHDSSQHFCLLATPQTLAHRVSGSEPYYWSRHLVVVRSYSVDIIEQALRRLDALGHLAEVSFPMLGRYEEARDELGRVTKVTRWKVFRNTTCPGDRRSEFHMLSPGQVGEALPASEFTHS